MVSAGKNAISSAIKKLSDSLPAWKKFIALPMLEASELYTYTPAVNDDDLPEQLHYWFRQEMQLPGRSTFILHNIYSTSNGVVFKNFQIFIPSLAGVWVKELFAYTFLLKQWYGKHIVLPEAEDGIALVYDQWSFHNNYYHWLVDCLPRLLVLREKFPNHLLLLPKSAAHFIKKTSAIVGFDRYLFIDKDEILEAHKFIIPEHTAYSLFHDPVLIKRVREEIISGLGKVAKQPSRRLYLSRSRQPKRRLMNEEAFVVALAKYNFEVIHFEDFSFEQQVALMQEAEVVVGVHGANMTNILFMQPKCTVVELLNIHSVNPLYFRLSSYLELAYYALPCEQVVDKAFGEDVGIMPAANDYHLIADLGKMERILASIFG